MPDPLMINVQDLHKHFGNKRAVDGISFTVNKGEVLGFLGPNGAGKSTTMRILTGFLNPDSGEIEIAGEKVTTGNSRVRRHFGYLPENAPLYEDMTVRGFLSLCASLRGLHGKSRKTAIDRVIELCFLDKVIHQSVDTLSKGYRHRTCLAQSLLHDPPVLILDEPTDGLDPNQKFEIRSLIKQMGREKAILFSTHILEEVEAVCSRAVIIDRGKIIADGTPTQLLARSPHSKCLRLHITGTNSNQARRELQIQPAIAKAETLNDNDPHNHATLRITPSAKATKEDVSSAILRLCNNKNWQLLEFRPEETRLDEVFRMLTKPDTASDDKQINQDNNGKEPIQ